MDSSRPNRPTKPVFDVINPGAGAAPNSRPVVTNNQPQQTDPMMAPANVAAVPIVPAPNSVQAPITPLPPEQPVAVSQVVTTEKPVSPPSQQGAAEAVHALQHSKAFYGNVSKPGKSKKVLGLLLLLALLSAVGFGGWMYLNKQAETRKRNDAAKTQSTTTATKVPEKVEDKTYTGKLGVFSISNEYGWKVLEADLTDTYGAAAMAGAKYGKISFAINDKQSLVFDINPGGRGGACEPKVAEKPFIKGNTCSSSEIVTVEKLSNANMPTDLLGVGAAGAYLAIYKYMGSDDVKPFTLVGLENSQKAADGKEKAIETGKPVMGAYVPYSILGIKTGYVETKIVDKDGKPTQLTDDDLEKVGIVLKTLKLTSAN